MRRVARLVLSSLLMAWEPSHGAVTQLPQDGLILCLDAAAQINLRQQQEWPEPFPGQPVGHVLNNAPSKASWHARQLTPSSRPAYRIGDRPETARWLFDGHDDFLSLNSPPVARLQTMTIFVVAAPRANAGAFSALLGASVSSHNDYTHGLNWDFGPSPTDELNVINVESAGSGGFQNLLTPSAAVPFGSFHVFGLQSQPGQPGHELYLNGQRQGSRPRDTSEIGLEEMIIGGRYYSNDPSQPPFAQGFFAGDLAVVLMYDRLLTNRERAQVEEALQKRREILNTALSEEHGHRLQTLPDPPVVQMLSPGFEVHELPISLPNQNNLRYRHDGQLVALGYDGRIRLLIDTDNDGLEDRISMFWDQEPLRAPIGLALLPANDPRGDGVFVASKAKVSLILDRDRDGHADEEIVVASGWKETPHGVDTLGVAIHPDDGSVYFSIGCENFANAYLIDPITGQSRFDLGTDRGTIQRVSADFSRRETVCTGIRFACALAFNRHGDLFATDQEGATWLPNGNPLDELLHIVPGRHYGFPPRHPQHLPQVIDEPAVVEYAPQHQSTVGLVFNEGVNGGPAFGPEHWHGDAIVAGESRGKLYRTKLVKTPHGYVGQNQLMACLGLLTVDACISPSGDLLVACHSGPPDWGTGPAGTGRLFKVRFNRKDIPQPVMAWASAPDEFRVAFDRPLNPSNWSGAKEKIRIEAGDHVRAGDRYEIIRPGYQVVRNQLNSLRRWIPVEGLVLTSDLRTMVLRVPRQFENTSYAVTLPVPEDWQVSSPSGVKQTPEMDLTVSFHGLEARQSLPDKTNRIVLPHPGMAISKALTRGSGDHEAFFHQLEMASPQTRHLELNGLVNVSNIFVPDAQAGSRLDWNLDDDSFARRVMTLHQDFSADLPSTVALPNVKEQDPSRQPWQLAWSGESDFSGSGMFVSLDQRQRPLSPDRLYLPWAKASPSAGEAAKEDGPMREDVAGNWLRGRRLFFGEAACATCHQIRGLGTPFGPDLSNLVHRDRNSVLQDILHPSATINPDHAGVRLTLRDGETMDGLLQTLDDRQAVLRQPAGVVREWTRREVADVAPLAGSLMPEGLGEQFGAEDIEDLLTFLLIRPLEPARIGRRDPPMPPARSLAQVEQVLGPFPGDVRQSDNSPLRILLCAGPKDHGPDEHDYPLWLERWTRLLSLDPQVSVAASMGFPEETQLDQCDVAVFYNANPDWNAAKARALDDYHERGGGAVYVHFAVAGGALPEAMAERVGLAFIAGSRFRHGPMELIFTQRDHPIARGMPDLAFVDETYWNMRGQLGEQAILGISREDQAPRPQLWVMERGNSRIVGCIPGHYMWTFDDPLFRVLLLRSISWAARQEDIDRLSPLATVGARIQR